MNDRKVKVKYNDGQGNEAINLIGYSLAVEHYGITSIKMNHTHTVWGVSEKGRSPLMFELAEKIYHNKHCLQDEWDYNNIKDLQKKASLDNNISLTDNAVNFMKYVMKHYMNL